MIDLDKLDALCEAATAGEWWVYNDGTKSIIVSNCMPKCTVAWSLGGKPSPNDAAFISAARQAVPELVTEVKRLRAERLRDTAREANDA